MEALRHHVQANGWSNVVVCDEAVGARAGSARLGIASSANEGKNSAARLERFPRAVTVPVVTLDERVPSLGLTRVDVIKIDVEGMEFDVLAGARTILQTSGPKLVFELTPDYVRSVGHEVSDVLGLLGDLGYELFEFADATTVRARGPGYRLERLRRPVDRVQLEVVAVRR